MIELSDIKKLYGDNPFTDILLYCCKVIAFGSVVKLESEAAKYETLESIKESDLYLTSLEDSGTFELYHYNETLLNMSSVPKNKVRFYAAHNAQIPTKYRDELYKIARDYTVAHYDEKNEYYRKICGMQKYNDYGIPLKPYLYLLPKGVDFGSAVYVHEIGSEGAKLLEKYGVMDYIKNDYPDAEYLDYMHCGITIQNARRHVDKQILYAQPCGLTEVDELFANKYEICREFVDRTVDSKAMEYLSENYQQFLVCYILFLTIIDVVSTTQERIIRKDILDVRCIKFIFEMYGIPYYRRIPLKFQTVMCKNVNRLCQYKSSPQEMFDLITYFEAEDQVDIKKYFLLRKRRYDSWGNFIYNRDEHHYMAKNEILVHRSIDAKIDKEKDDEIPFPFLQYLRKGNELIIWADAYKLIEGADYEIYNYNKIKFLDSKWKNCRRLTYDFYYDKSTFYSEIVDNKTYSLKITEQTLTNTDGSNKYALKLPFKNYLFADNDVILMSGRVFVDPSLYSIDNEKNIITINSNVTTKPFTAIYIYNRDPEIDDDKIKIPVNGQVTYDIQSPYDSYLTSNNYLFVFIDKKFIRDSLYTIDKKNNTITFDSILGSSIKKDKYIEINFIKDLNDSVTKYDMTKSKIPANNQASFVIPEPWDYYIANNNYFFVSINDQYIDSTAYTVDRRTHTITFDSTVTPNIVKDQYVKFYFVYAKQSIPTPVDAPAIKVKKETITATQNFQYQFTLNYPIDSYIQMGFKPYIKMRGWYMDDHFFTLYADQLVINDKSMSLQPGETIDLEYYYVDPGNDTRACRGYIDVNQYFKSEFDIEYPKDNFFERGNSLLVDMDGYPLQKGTHYYFKNNNQTIVFTDPNHIPKPGTKINFVFIYSEEYEYTVRTKEEINEVVIEDNIEKFYFKYPFYPYTETGHSYVVTDHNHLILNSFVTSSDKIRTIITDKTTFNSGDKISILYIYNKDYELKKENSVIRKEVTFKKSDMSNPHAYPIKEPYEEYVINDWFWFVDTDRYRQKENRDFDVMNNDIVFSDRTAPRTIDLYNSLTETFIYKEDYPWKYDKSEDDGEDVDKDFKLEFMKIPLKNLTDNDKIIKLNMNLKSYDVITLADPFWDGDDNADNAHEAIKHAILKTPFNYLRTKYMGIEYLVDLAEMGFEIPYFYNILFDDVLKEEDVTVQVPTIAPYHKIKLGHLFAYMISLAYFYRGMDDTIMKTPTQILYCKGFNFHADLEVLRKWILDLRYRDIDYKDVFRFAFGYDQGDDGTGNDTNNNGDKFSHTLVDMHSPKELVDVFRNNKDIYKIIAYGMINANDYDTYSIWKKMYDSLMRWKFNLDYFKLDSTGQVANTFTEFLQEKDPFLYNSLKSIEDITDEDARNDEILKMFDDIIYILDEYIDSKEFKYIYYNFPGFGEYLAEYLFTMINFFKSYKVIFNQITTNLDLKGQTPDNTIKIYDHIDKKVELNKPDYITVRDSPVWEVLENYEERMYFREKIAFLPLDKSVKKYLDKWIFDVKPTVITETDPWKFAAALYTEYTLKDLWKFRPAIKADPVDIDKNIFDTNALIEEYLDKWKFNIKPLSITETDLWKFNPEIIMDPIDVDKNKFFCGELLRFEFDDWKFDVKPTSITETDLWKFKPIFCITKDGKGILLDWQFDVKATNISDLDAWKFRPMFYATKDKKGFLLNDWQFNAIGLVRKDIDDNKFQPKIPITTNLDNWKFEIVLVGVGYPDRTIKAMYPENSSNPTLGYDKMTSIPADILSIDNLKVNTIRNSLYQVFKGCEKLTSVPKVINTDKANDMAEMFSGCKKLTAIDLDYDTSNVTNMNRMFYHCDNVTSFDTSSFNTNKVTNMANMFSFCRKATNIDISGLDTSNVYTMSNMFSYCEAVLSLDVSSWNTSNCNDMSGLFYDCRSMPTVDVTNFDTSKVNNMSKMFSFCKGLTSLDVTKFDTSMCSNMSNMFYQCNSLPSLDVTKFDTSIVTDMSGMFYYCNSLPTLDVTNFKTNMCMNMSKMFAYCSSLPTVDVTNFDTAMVTDMSGMFYYCMNMTSLDVTNFDTTNCTDMEDMFGYCEKLKSIDVSNFDTSRVKNMGGMFYECESLTSLDLSNFDTSNVTDMSHMFDYCENLVTLDISSFDMSNVTNMSNMFSNCRKLTSITDIDMQSVDCSNSNNYRDMFKKCDSLTNVKILNTTADFDPVVAGLNKGQYTLI